MLTDRELIAINSINGNQPLSPFVAESCKFKINGPSFGLSSAGYDIRLHHEFVEFKKQFDHHQYYLDPLQPDFNFHLNFSTVRHNVLHKQYGGRIRLDPGDFVLAASLEMFDMPDNLVAEVKDKSSLARLGIAVQNTLIEPGWKGRLTLEITNHNRVPVVLTAGMGIAQIVFHELSSRPLVTYSDRKGKYQYQGMDGQAAVTLPR